MIRTIAFTTLLACASFATSAMAHSKVASSVPADGEILSTAPTQITIAFHDAMRLTKVELVADAGDTALLDLGDQTSFAKDYSFDLSDIAAGTYSVEYRGLGMDGHPMTGSLSFTLN